MYLNDCKRTSPDKYWKWIISKWKQPRYIHRRILPTAFSKHSLLYIYTVYHPGLYLWEAHVQIKKKKKKLQFSPRTILQRIQWAWSFPSIFPILVPTEMRFHCLLYADNARTCQGFMPYFHWQGGRRKNTLNEEVLRYLFTSKWRIKLAREHENEVFWKASWLN